MAQRRWEGKAGKTGRKIGEKDEPRQGAYGAPAHGKQATRGAV